jgi:sigma-E factor negative regulatory protein RseA
MVMDGISALMDGELAQREGEREIARLKIDSELRIRWDEFHLIRDTLTGEPVLSPGFSETLSRRLADEPTVLAPRRLVSKTRRLTTYAMSAAASIAAAVFVVSVALQPSTSNVAKSAAGITPVIATPVSAPEQARIDPPSVPNDGRMNDYLLAHEGWAAGSSLHRFTPYIRVSTMRVADR